jgi:hypothetical protein
VLQPKASIIKKSAAQVAAEEAPAPPPAPVAEDKEKISSDTQ